MAKTKKYLYDGVWQDAKYVRAWKEKREIVVQVWNGTKPVPEDEPDGDWTMPGVLGTVTAITQAVFQTGDE